MNLPSEANASEAKSHSVAFGEEDILGDSRGFSRRTTSERGEGEVVRVKRLERGLSDDREGMGFVAVGVIAVGRSCLGIQC